MSGELVDALLVLFVVSHDLYVELSPCCMMLPQCEHGLLLGYVAAARVLGVGCNLVTEGFENRLYPWLASCGGVLVARDGWCGRW